MESSETGTCTRDATSRSRSEADDHFYRVVRYVERNALRANLVESAELWRWSSLWTRLHGTAEQRRLLSEWPLGIPTDWRRLVNEPQTEAEVESIRQCIGRGRPFGNMPWVRETARALGLESTLRSRGRPPG